MKSSHLLLHLIDLLVQSNDSFFRSEGINTSGWLWFSGIAAYEIVDVCVGKIAWRFLVHPSLNARIALKFVLCATDETGANIENKLRTSARAIKP